MIDGIFRLAYTGTEGTGFGLLVLLNGSIVGADVSGGLYDGTYSEDLQTGKVRFSLNVAAPAGVPLVQTGVAPTSPVNIPITAYLDRDDLSSEKPILIKTHLGPVNVLFTKIRDYPT